MTSGRISAARGGEARMRPARLKAIALTTAALLLPPAAAQAQQATPAYNWSGFYVGLNAGGAWGQFDARTSIPCTTAVAPLPYLCGIGSVVQQTAAAGTGSLSDGAFTGGVQAGYNWQNGNLVYGLEADFGTFNLGATRQVTESFVAIPFNVFTITSSADTDWLFTARGRFGWAFSNVLAYATGGLAVTRIHTAHSYSDTAGPASGAWSASKTKLGWTLGGGLEWALGSNWTLKAEYLYLNFGSVDAAGVVTSPGGYGDAINTSVDLTAHVARAGVNFKF